MINLLSRTHRAYGKGHGVIFAQCRTASCRSFLSGPMLLVGLSFVLADSSDAQSFGCREAVFR